MKVDNPLLPLALMLVGVQFVGIPLIALVTIFVSVITEAL